MERASFSLNHSVVSVTVSPRNSRRITSSDSTMRSRCCIGSMPSISASEVSSPGPTPNITRPMVMWSSWMMRFAAISGL